MMFTKTELVRFRHTDFAGIVFYPRFFEMVNDLVEDWFAEALGRPFSRIHETHGVPTVDLKVQFRQAARIGETITKHLWVNHLGSSSVVLGFRFENESRKTVLEGEATLVNVALGKDSNGIKPEAFDDSTRNKILTYTRP